MTDQRWESLRRMVVAIQVAATIFFCAGWFTAEQWIDVAKWNMGLFLAASVGDAFAGGQKRGQ